MRQLMKKGVSFLLAAVMVLSLCPMAGVRAAGEDEEITVYEHQDVDTSKELTESTDSFTMGSVSTQDDFTENGKFRIEYSTADPSKFSSMNLVLKVGDDWTWKEVSPSADSTGNDGQGNYWAEYKYADCPGEARDETSKTLRNVKDVGAKIQIVSGSTGVSVRVTRLAYIKSDNSTVEIIAKDESNLLTKTRSKISLSFSEAATSMKNTGYFRMEYTVPDSGTLRGTLVMNMNTQDGKWGQCGAKGDPAELGGGKYSAQYLCSEFKKDGASVNYESADYQKLTELSVEFWAWGDGDTVSIDKVIYVNPAEVIDDGSTTITQNEWKSEGEYSVILVPGGYFHVEFPASSVPDNLTLVLQGDGDNRWVPVSPSLIDGQTVRAGKADGKDGFCYAEFAYSDCLRAWKTKSGDSNFDNLKNIRVQDGSEDLAQQTLSIKYFPDDPTPPLESGSLSTDCVVLGSPVTASLETGTPASCQWYRVVGNATANGTAISGATASSYTPTEADKGCWIYCVMDGKIAAGPAAVVVSKAEQKTSAAFTGSKALEAGGTADLWFPSSSAAFNKAMIVPGGFFRMKCEPADANVRLVLKDPWTEIPVSRREDGSLIFTYEDIVRKWTGNFGSIGEIDVKNYQGAAITVESLEWVGYDIGVSEIPYLPTDELPFGGDPWVREWQEGSDAVEDEEHNRISVRVRYTTGEWEKTRLKTHSDTGFIVDPSHDMISLNIYLEKSAVDAGGGKMHLQIENCTEEADLNITGEENVVTVDGTACYRTGLNFPVSAFPERFNDFVLEIRGENTTFSGTIMVENITLRKAPESDGAPVELVTGSNPVSFNNGTTANVTVSGGRNLSAFYSDGMKLYLRAPAAPAGEVQIRADVNGSGATEILTLTPDRFQASGGGYTAEVDLKILSTIARINNIGVTVTPAVPGLTLTGLQLLPKKPETPAGSGGGSNLGGGGGGSGLITLPYTWEFLTNVINAWKYEPGWDSNYSGRSGTSVTYKNGRMEVYVNYSRDRDQSWSQMAVTLWHNRGMYIKNATHVYLDLYYLPEKLDGSLTMKLYSGGAKIDAVGTVDWDGAVEAKVDGKLYRKVRVDFVFPPVGGATVHDMALCFIGQNTTYRGPLLVEAMTIEEAYAGTFVWSKHLVKKENSSLRLRDRELVTASGETAALPAQVTLADGRAEPSVRSVYAYLQAVGATGDLLFGQQYNFGQKAGSSNLTDSDTCDLVGDYAAVFGLDGLALAGAEFSAGRCNELYKTPFPSTAEGNVAAAAYLTNTAIKRGAIVTLSCHMPNFSQVKTVTPNCSASYARYNFAEYTPNVLTGDTANEILPGGRYHEIFRAYLDMIADYANRVDGAVLFRPFHENTGSWFWWGAESCEAETFKNLYRYTVEYLRDERNVHNFLYVYGPGSEAKTLEDYAARYPGDSYVDLVGFDMYNRDPDENSGWLDEFRQQLDLVSRFARQHGKLTAVTETGAANDTAEGDRQTALLRTGNKDKDWYRRVLEVVSGSPASYLLLWANFGKDNGFYTPYVVLTEGRSHYGHEMMDNFIDFYNEPRSVFAGDQKDALSALPRGISAKAAGTEPEGYITAPVSGRQVRAGTAFTARVSRADGLKIQFVIHGKGGSVTLDARSAGGPVRQAQVSQTDLDALGDLTDGTAELLIGGKVQQTIRLNSSTPFLDVPADAYYAPAVQWALAQGITGGTAATTFSPNKPCTRAQVVTFLWRAAGSPAPAGSENPFRDVAEDAYYCQAVLWAVEQGITAGVTKTAFQPGAAVTRAQTAAFLYRAAGAPAAAKDSGFRDVASTAYYAPAVRWALDKGVTGGTTAETFSPNSPCTRAQIVTFLYRAQ